MLTFIVIIILLVIGIYKINNRFQKKELFIFLGIITIIVISTLYFIDQNENKVPQLFKTKYEKENNVKIEKLSFERVNNKTLSSDTNFIYNFDFISLKDGSEYICNIKNVKIKKIEDEFIFENFEKLNKDCKKK
jgi:hypothetical protein